LTQTGTRHWWIDWHAGIRRFATFPDSDAYVRVLPHQANSTANMHAWAKLGALQTADSQLSELQNSDAEEAFADEEEEVEGESEWLKDISIHAKNLLKHKLTPLQKPIVELYKNYSVLDKAADKALWELGNITGEPVVWNRKALLQDDAEEEEMEFSSSGRRRSSRDLPPRARYVNKILIYLDKEMKAVWNLHTIVDRKRWGLDNIVTSNPEGPGSASLAQEESAEEPKITNKYEEHLYEDYHALLKNIKDAGEKLEELKISLANSTANMHAWAKI